MNKQPTRIFPYSYGWRICLFLTVAAACLTNSAALPGTSLIDSSGSTLYVQRIPETLMAGSTKIISVISSPGTPSSLVDNGSPSAAEVSLSLDDSILSDSSSSSSSSSNNNPILLYCRGATLAGVVSESADPLSVGTCSLISDVLVVDGVTAGDVLKTGIQRTRHARTLMMLFRARLMQSSSVNSSRKRQTLMIGLIGDDVRDEGITKMDVLNDLKELYEVAVAESASSNSPIPTFEQAYDVKVVPVATSEDAQQAIFAAKEAASGTTTVNEDYNGDDFNEPMMSLSTFVVRAHTLIKEKSSGGSSSSSLDSSSSINNPLLLDPPSLAMAYVAIGTAFTKHARTARALILSWKSRVARGLWVDGFGLEAEQLRDRVIRHGFDVDTLETAGLPLVAPYRLQRRNQLQSMVDSFLIELYNEQIKNLEKSTLKRFEAKMLRTVNNEDAESIVNSNAVALRTESYQFEAVATDLQIPSLLGPTAKDKAVREFSGKLNNAMMSFPDGPAAKIKRTKKVESIINKDNKKKKKKKNAAPAIDIGLDLVAVLRPDGFGSLQGFAGYQIGGNSLTFGIHNDADDPQVIAQFGGVRPPLLRVQPKLRVDVEL